MFLYGLPLSPFVRKAMLHAPELGFEQQMVTPQSDSSRFSAASSLGRILAFEDGDFRTADSSEICKYLERHYAGALIASNEACSAAQIVRFDKYADDDLAPAVFDPLLERVIKPVRLRQSADEAQVEQSIRDKIPPAFGYLEENSGS